MFVVFQALQDIFLLALSNANDLFLQSTRSRSYVPRFLRSRTSLHKGSAYRFSRNMKANITGFFSFLGSAYTLCLDLVPTAGLTKIRGSTGE